MAKTGVVTVLGTLCFLIILAVVGFLIWFFGSLRQVDSTEVGIDFNTNTQQLDKTQIFEQGTHRTGLYNQFILYKTSVDTLDFNLSGRTKDGLTLTVKISYQYRIEPELDQLIRLSYEFPENSYKSLYNKLSQDVFRTVIAKYATFQFITHKSDIENQLKVSVDKELQKYGAVISNFQLLGIEFAKLLKTAIDKAEQTKLNIEQTIESVQQIEAQLFNDLEKAQKQAKTFKDEQEILRDKIAAQTNQRINELKNRLDQQKQNLPVIITNLGFSADQLNQYLWLNGVNSVGSKKATRIPTPPNIQCIFAGNSGNYYQENETTPTGNCSGYA